MQIYKKMEKFIYAWVYKYKICVRIHVYVFSSAL